MSTIKVNTLEEATVGGATFYTAKAWVNVNGTGTVAIRDDGNVSSITDGGTGVYTSNFSANLSGSNYAVNGNCAYPSTTAPYGLVSFTSNYSMLSSSIKVRTVNSTIVEDMDSPLVMLKVSD